MLRLIIFLLDLVLISSMSTLMSGSATTVFKLRLVILFTLRGTLNAVVAWQLKQTAETPSKAINNLLQPILTPRGDGCPICFDTVFRPHRISCNHVFCRDCALLMLAQRDTCPLCLRIPLPLRKKHKAFSLETVLTALSILVFHWIRTFFTFSLAYIAQCFWHLRVPTSSEMMLAAMRTTLHNALYLAVVDVIHPIAWISSSPDKKAALADYIAAAYVFVVTLSYDYAAWGYLAGLLSLSRVSFIAFVPELQ